MDINLRVGRIVGPVHFVNAGGKSASIPQGPCLLEQIDNDRVDVIWGETGQRSAVLSTADLEAAAMSGSLLLLGATVSPVTGGAEVQGHSAPRRDPC